MTDEPDEQLAPLSPEDEARLRGLLADARETGPMPADVTARLDQVITGLATARDLPEPHPATGSEAVVPLVRTRRHRVVAWVGAAAAVAVFGLGVGAVINQDQGDGDAGTAADSAPVERGAAEDDLQDGPGIAPTADETEAAEGEQIWIKRVDRGPAYVVRSAHLTRDLDRIRAARVDPVAAGYDMTTIFGPRSFSCPSADWGRGILVAARYDGAPAYVAFREPMGESQVVEVLQCGTGELLRSTTLPTIRR